MAQVLFSLGANLGEAENTLKVAVKELSQQTLASFCKISSLYKTKPVGYASQPDFFNLCVSIITDKAPLTILSIAKGLETAHHRERLIKNGPRTLDIDILAYDDLIMERLELTLPHPRMHERAFVLIPLDEIVPNFIIQKYHSTVHNLRMALSSEECSGVVKVE